MPRRRQPYKLPGGPVRSIARTVLDEQFENLKDRVQVMPEQLFNREDLNTPAMRFLEEKFNLPIEQLIGAGGIKDVGARLGIGYVTISRWRHKLHLWADRYCYKHELHYEEQCGECLNVSLAKLDKEIARMDKEELAQSWAENQNHSGNSLPAQT